MALGGSSSRRFAEALMDLAVEAGAVTQFRDSLVRLAAAFDADTIRALRDPGQALAQRLEAVEQAAHSEPPAIRSLLRLLVERDRIALLSSVAYSFGQIVDRRDGIAEARVTTAVPLPQDQQSAFVARLEKASGTKIRASFLVEPELLGGAKVQIGDHQVDGSLRAQLETLRAQLAS